MSLFGKIVRTTINVVTLPVAVTKDVFTLGGISTKGEFSPYIAEKLKQIKDDAK